jgi:hypothetical protein
MTTENTRAERPLEDALYALALATPAPDATILDDLVRRYPEHAGALTDMAIELALDALDEDPAHAETVPSTEAGTAVSNAMSRFHNRLFHVKQAERASRVKAASEAKNPFASLDRAGMRALGVRLKANTVFVVKLRDRHIAAETITAGFQRHVADTMAVPFELLAAHFAGQAQLGTHAHYKADHKPEAGIKQSFEEAVRSSGLTSEQQAYLLSL